MPFKFNFIFKSIAYTINVYSMCYIYVGRYRINTQTTFYNTTFCIQILYEPYEYTTYYNPLGYLYYYSKVDKYKNIYEY